MIRQLIDINPIWFYLLLPFQTAGGYLIGLNDGIPGDYRALILASLFSPFVFYTLRSIGLDFESKIKMHVLDFFICISNVIIGSFIGYLTKN